MNESLEDHEKKLLNIIELCRLKDSALAWGRENGVALQSNPRMRAFTEAYKQYVALQPDQAAARDRFVIVSEALQKYGNEFSERVEKQRAHAVARAAGTLMEQSQADSNRMQLEADAKIDALTNAVSMTRAEIARLKVQLFSEASFPLRELHELVSECDWRDEQPTKRKILACALVAKLAYAHVPDSEVSHVSRYTIVPCNLYRRIVRRELVLNVAEAVRSSDLGEPLLIERKGIVIVGIRFPTVVFLGVRGTSYSYDWRVNFRAWKINAPNVAQGAGIHSGFYREVGSTFEELSQKLAQLDVGDTPVYLAGHSLGGAMGAIIHHGQICKPTNGIADIRTHSCYTFGMPRYASARAIASMRLPHPFLNTKDPVTGLPFKLMGYADVPGEESVDQARVRKRRISRNLVGCVSDSLRGRGIKYQHNMERYVEFARRTSRLADVI
jgi:hypothetical protein